MVKKENKKVVIIIMGPPGSGKGTQAELLSEKFNLYYLETAKIGEERINQARKGEYILADGKKYYFEEQKKLWLEGKLWLPPFVVYLIEEKIKELFKEKNGIICAGSPRTLYECEKIIPLLAKLYRKENIKIIQLLLSPKESIFRNSHRKICELMRHPILYTKETENLTKCPLDGSKLLKREGLDSPETIKIRLKEYEERTLPIIDYFKKSGLEVKKIDGSPPPADVFESILKSL